MILNILQHPNQILRNISENVSEKEFNTPALNKLIQDMSETLRNEHDGVAIAAPQIGVNKRIFVVLGNVLNNFKYQNEKLETNDVEFINPEIIKVSKDKKLMHEGCLSVRPLYGDVRRASRIILRAQNKNGEWFEASATGLLAEIFQHENDHLNGVLFIDTAKNIKDGEKRDLVKKSKTK